MLYGTADGKVGLLKMGESSASTLWEMDNEQKKGGIGHSVQSDVALLFYLPRVLCHLSTLFRVK